MGWTGAEWLERPGRDEEQRPDEIVEKMGLRDGDVVADLGAGTGYFTRRLAKAVAPSGRVYGVDIQPEMIGLLKQRGPGSPASCVLGGRRSQAAEGLARLDPARGCHGSRSRRRCSRGCGGAEARRQVALVVPPRGRPRSTSARSTGCPRQVAAGAGGFASRRHEFLPTQHFFVFEKGGPRDPFTFPLPDHLFWRIGGSCAPGSPVC
jgi:SAM-dependent methyltransferase